MKLIEINLLPEEIKQSRRKQVLISQLFLFIVPAVFGLLVIIHLYMGMIFLFRTLQYKSVNRKWTQVAPQREKVDAWRKEYKINSREIEQITKLLTRRITIADKMQTLASVLPNGIWFNHLGLDQNKFRLEGSVVSLKKDQISLLNLFLGRLKEDKSFFKDFVRLELGQMNMRTLGGFSIMDFVLEGDLK